MKRETDIDLQTRHLMKALEPALRSHLGADGVHRQFVAALYGRLWQSLAESGGLHVNSGKWGAENSRRLALDVYLTAATHLEEDEVTPAFLSSVQGAIEKVFRDFPQ